MIINNRQSGQIHPFALSWNIPKKSGQQTFGNRFKGFDLPPVLADDSLRINDNHKKIVESLKRFDKAKNPEEQKAPRHKLILERSNQMFTAFTGLFQDFYKVKGKIAHSTEQALKQVQNTLKCQAELLEYLRGNNESDIYLTLPRVKKSYQALDTYFKKETDLPDSN